ncbi:MAG: hypothetical protein V1792_25945 [Pseudomonadota bacterium]
MEPTAEKLLEDMEKIQKKQDDLSDRIYHLHMEELLPIQQQVADLQSYVKLITRIVPCVLGVASIILGLAVWLGYDWWEKGLVEITTSKVINNTNLVGALTPEVTRIVIDKVYPELDKSLFLSADIERYMEAVNEKKEGAQDEALCFLRSAANDQPKREYIFRRYMDLLIQANNFPDAYEFLRRVEENKIFPTSYIFSKTFSAAAFVFWVQSFYDQADYRDTKACELMADAWKSLKNAREKAEKNIYRNEADRDMRTYHWYCFLFNLSEKKDGAAKISLEQFLNIRGEADWSKISKEDWFDRLLKKRPHVQTLLEEICKKSFPNLRMTKDNTY